ncbi:MAG: helix-turn-helix domain-containing protein [Candidatus Pacebacteria bacterium]|nr:helix-turn-helix domain-containing protein [Candidatus Paceibacterota bacterium]
MEDMVKKLQKLGFKDKEADVYLAVLQLGEATVSDIAREAKMKRTTVYEYLDTLLTEGLVSKTAHKKRTLYVPEHPKKILRNFGKREALIRKEKEAAEEFLPELESLYGFASSHPAVKFYEGRSGLLEVYRQIAETHTVVYSFFTPKKFYETFSHEQNDALLMRLRENGAQLHNLIEHSEAAKERLRLKKYDDFVKNKVLPKDFHFETDLVIYGDTIALISYRKMIAVLVHDQAIADLQRNIFKLIWQSL